MSLNIALRTALTGLSLNQSALQVTANNVANVNTEGYTRKIVETASISLTGIGAGVRLVDVTRYVDAFLQRQLRDTLGLVGNYEIQDRFLSQTQDLFGAPGDHNSISARITDLATALDSLAHEPEGAATQYGAVNAAILMAAQLSEMARDLQRLRAESDRAIADSIALINSQLSIIADLNTQIARANSLGQPIGEFQDKRDVALDKIGAEMDIRYFESADGKIVVVTPGGRSLINGTVLTLLSHVPGSNLTTNLSYIDRSISGFYNQGGITGIYVGTPESAGGNDITNEITTGRLKAYVELRDETLAGMQSQLDELAYRLREVVNGAHNDGAAFPPPSILTGGKTFVGTDALSGSGNFQIAVVNQTTGAIVSVQQIAVTGTDVTAQIAAINTAMGAGFASLTSSGALRLDSSVIGANLGIVIAENDSAINIASETRGFSHFFGLNDLLVDSSAYAGYDSQVQGTATTALGISGNLVFNLPGGSSVTIAIASGDTLAQVATAINGDATLTTAAISARLVADGAGYRLNIIDSGGDNFFLSGTGNVMSTLALVANKLNSASIMTVRSDIAADPQLVTRGDVAYDATLIAGNIRIGTSDGSAAKRLADAFNQNQTFNLAGGLPQLTVTVARYAAQVLSLNASKASNASIELEFGASLRQQLTARVASVSGVNMDEELSNLIILQNAYAATARIVSVTGEMFETLLAAV